MYCILKIFYCTFPYVNTLIVTLIYFYSLFIFWYKRNTNLIGITSSSIKHIHSVVYLINIQHFEQSSCILDKYVDNLWPETFLIPS